MNEKGILQRTILLFLLNSLYRIYYMENSVNGKWDKEFSSISKYRVLHAAELNYSRIWSIMVNRYFEFDSLLDDEARVVRVFLGSINDYLFILIHFSFLKIYILYRPGNIFHPNCRNINSIFEWKRHSPAHYSITIWKFFRPLKMISEKNRTAYLTNSLYF